MTRQSNSSSSTINIQDNRVAQNENKKSPEIKLRDMEDCDLNDSEVRIVVMRKKSLNKMEENSER